MTSSQRSSGGRLRRVTALAALVLTGCASFAPDESAPPAGLFRVDGVRAADIAPGPQAGWYADRPRYSETGFAAWRSEPERRASKLRWLRRRASVDAYPVAVAAAHTNLPLPSIVEVTNLRTGVTVKARVEDRAPMPGNVISLGESVAAQLGAAPTGPLLVRVRYSAPVLVYRETPKLSFAWLRRPAPSPEPAPVQLAAAPSAAAAPAPAVATAPPASPPPATAAPAQASAPAQPLAIAAKAAPVSPAQHHSASVQAGAFANPANARRAAAMLAAAGPVRIEPLVGRTRTLYRVLVGDESGGADARALRSRVVALGFADAMISRE